MYGSIKRALKYQNNSDKHTNRRQSDATVMLQEEQRNSLTPTHHRNSKTAAGVDSYNRGGGVECEVGIVCSNHDAIRWQSRQELVSIHVETETGRSCYWP